MPEFQSIGVTPTTRELMPLARKFAEEKNLTILHPFYEHVVDTHKILEVECACGSVLIVVASRSPLKVGAELPSEWDYRVELVESGMRKSKA
jgi:hypothetical protein